MVKIKNGAKLNGITTHMVIALIVAEGAYSKYGAKCIITEGTGGKHGIGSLHYVGNGLDLRTRNLSAGTDIQVADEIRINLGGQYDVICESDHIHIEFQPK